MEIGWAPTYRVTSASWICSECAATVAHGTPQSIHEQWHTAQQQIIDDIITEALKCQKERLDLYKPIRRQTW